MIDNLKSDLRFALRGLRRSPVFTLVAVLAITLGTGAVTTVFSAMNALVLRPVPGTRDGDRLVSLQIARRDGSVEQAGTYPLYQRLREGTRAVNGLAAWGRTTLTIASGQEGTVVAGNYASANYFSVLGLRPALGRFFLPEEDHAPGTHPVLVVSHAFWSAHLGADSSAVGRTLTVNGHPYTLVGVAPEGFVGTIALLHIDGWVPIMMTTQLTPERSLERAQWMRMFGRLADGATLERAQVELTALAASSNDGLAAADSMRVVRGVQVAALRSVPEDARGSFLGFMALLLGAATLVLLIASVDVASMLSARAIARRRELAVRAAIGAGRRRLAAQLLTEVLLLFALGAAGGVALAFAATRAAAAMPLPTDVISPPDMSPDLRVMAFALLVSLATGLVFGLVPALRASRQDIATRLRNDAAGAGSRRGWAGNALIVSQLALSLVLLVAAGLFTRALDVGSRVDPGFEPRGVSIASFDARTWGYDDEKAERFYRTLDERMSAVPGVSGVAFASFAPLTTRSMNDSITTDAGTRAFTWLVNVGGDYFETLHMPLVAGREVTRTDDARAARVALVNETLAKRLAPDGSALGRTFRRDTTLVTVVGVVRDAKYASFVEEPPPVVFYPLGQAFQPHQTLLVRSSLGSAAIAAALRDALRAIDPATPVPVVQPLEEAMGITMLPQKIGAVVTGVLGGVGLLLATLGLYGVIAYSVNRRTREMGVRVALGARRGDVLGLVLREGLRLALGGVAIGLAAAAGATRLIAGFLFDVSALDTPTFAGMGLFFVVVALLATLLPARRAAGADPMVALRSE